MRMERYRCEMCSKETEDCYSIPGWINIDIKKIMICKGRKKSGGAKTRYQDFDYDPLDFCSEKCFTNYFHRLFKKKAN